MGAVVDEFKHWDGGLGIDENPFSEIQWVLLHIFFSGNTESLSISGATRASILMCAKEADRKAMEPTSREITF